MNLVRAKHLLMFKHEVFMGYPTRMMIYCQDGLPICEAYIPSTALTRYLKERLNESSLFPIGPFPLKVECSHVTNVDWRASTNLVYLHLYAYTDNNQIKIVSKDLEVNNLDRFIGVIRLSPYSENIAREKRAGLILSRLGD